MIIHKCAKKLIAQQLAVVNQVEVNFKGSDLFDALWYLSRGGKDKTNIRDQLVNGSDQYGDSSVLSGVACRLLYKRYQIRRNLYAK